jgi:hypothetical protein
MAVATSTTTKPPSRTTKPPTAAQLLSALDVVSSFVSSFDPALYDGKDAARLVEAFTRGKRLCSAGETLAASRAAECHAHLGTGHRDPAEWLAAVTGSSRGEATDTLSVGTALAAQPGVEDALRKGKLTSQRAKLVTEAVKVNPKREDDLVKGAESDTVRQLKERCLRAKAEGRSAEEAERRRAALHAARHCRTWTDGEGAFHLEALLTPEAGGSLLAALEAQADRHFHRARRAGTREAPEAYRADALVALVTGQGILPPVTGQQSSPDGEASGSRSPESRPHVQVKVGLQSLRRGSVVGGETCEIPGVGPVSVQYARDLLGDALLDIIISDGVDVTTVVRPRRNIPTPLATALRERDQFCVVPGCGKRLGLEKDHWKRAVKDDGEASYDNLVRLCKHHHYLRTHKGWVLSGGPGHWSFDPPDRPPDRPLPGRRPRSGQKASPPETSPSPRKPRSSGTTASDTNDPSLFTPRK